MTNPKTETDKALLLKEASTRQALREFLAELIALELPDDQIDHLLVFMSSFLDHITYNED